MKFVKWFACLSVVALSIWLTISLFGTSSQSNQAVAAAPAAPQAMPVTVMTVHPEEIQEWHEFSGKLVAIDTVQIRPRVGGAIDKILFEPGTIVQEGAPLFQIDPRPYQAEVNRAAAAVTAAKAQANLANSISARADRLIKENAIAKRDFDERKNSASVAKANIASAEAALQQAKLNLDYATIKAPITGKIARAEITLGNIVESGPNAPVLATIVSLQSIYADFDIDEQTYLTNVRTHNGDTNDQSVPVELSLANDATNKNYEGKIALFDNTLDSTAGTIRARAIFDNTDMALIPGMFAKVRLGSTDKISAILIPDSVVNTDQDKKFVYVVNKDNKVEYRPITAGSTSKDKRIVLNGLNEGDKVITNNLMKLRPDMPITPQEDAPAADAAATPAAATTDQPATTDAATTNSAAVTTDPKPADAAATTTDTTTPSSDTK
jgi:multidrug efflux system membrane fusion protein